MKKIIFLCFLVLPFLLGLKSGNTIKVGVAIPLSAGAKNTGNDVKNGVQMAVDEWNMKGGVLGKKIELVLGDDRGDATMAEKVANRLINDQVVGIIGHVNSDVSLAALKYYNRAGIPMISPVSTNPALTNQGYIGVFRTCGKDDLQAKVAANFIKKLNLKNMALIHDNTIYGKWLVDEFMKNINGELDKLYYSAFDRKTDDFKPILKELIIKKPDLIYFAGIYSDAAILFKQVREAGINAVFMSGDIAADPKFIEIAGNFNLQDVYFTANPDITMKPKAKNFVANYTKKFGAVGDYSENAYDAANALFTAIEEAGTTSGPEIIAKLHNLKFDGVLGRFKFDSKGDINNASYAIWTINDGKLIETNK